MAYGKVRGNPKPLGEIPARIYPIETNASKTRAAILTIPLDFDAGDELDADLVKKLHDDFNEYNHYMLILAGNIATDESF